MKFSTIAHAIRRALGYAEIVNEVVDDANVSNSEKHNWQLNAYGGGSLLWPGTRESAVNKASQLGTVAYVDDNAHMVFYKPTGWNGGLPGA